MLDVQAEQQPVSNIKLVTPLPEATLREWGLWLIRRRRRLRVSGESMSPTLAIGDLVLVDANAYRGSMPRPGDVVVALHPFQQNLSIIKRVAAITANERVELRSDNPNAGSDSRHFGTLSAKLIVGRVTCRVPVIPTQGTTSVP